MNHLVFVIDMIFQAYALLSEYMGNLSDMESIKYILYDDNCHLVKFAENEERAAKTRCRRSWAKERGCTSTSSISRIISEKNVFKNVILTR